MVESVSETPNETCSLPSHTLQVSPSISENANQRSNPKTASPIQGDSTGHVSSISPSTPLILTKRLPDSMLTKHRNSFRQLDGNTRQRFVSPMFAAKIITTDIVIRPAIGGVAVVVIGPVMINGATRA